MRYHWFNLLSLTQEIKVTEKQSDLPGITQATLRFAHCFVFRNIISSEQSFLSTMKCLLSAPQHFLLTWNLPPPQNYLLSVSLKMGIVP